MAARLREGEACSRPHQTAEAKPGLTTRAPDQQSRSFSIHFLNFTQPVCKHMLIVQKNKKRKSDHKLRAPAWGGGLPPEMAKGHPESQLC